MANAEPVERAAPGGAEFRVRFPEHSFAQILERRPEMAFRNEGTVDRVLRVLFGALLLSLAFVGPKTAWGWIGVVPLATGLIGNCPVYSIFGINTCGVKR
jgi:hypothetical protein